MKKGIFNFNKTTAFAVVASVLALSSCKKDRMPVVDPIPTTTAGIYVLCEGPYDQVNNSSITYYDVTTKSVDKDYFKTRNGINLGTNANDLKQYGSKAYCVITGKDKSSRDSYVEVINISTGKSLKRIPFFSTEANFAARFVAFYKDKAYVSSYDGYISKIDTASLTIESRILVGGALEGVAIVNDKLYVTNSDHPIFVNADNSSVSVVDLKTFEKIKSIPVSFNPGKIVATNNGDLFSIARGKYGSTTQTPALDRLSSVSDTKVQSLDYNLSLVAVNNTRGLVIGYNPDYTTYLKDITSSGVLGKDFIKDGTALISPYGITFNTVKNEILITDTRNSITSGKVFCFGPDGKIKYDFETGSFPQSAVFNNK